MGGTKAASAGYSAFKYAGSLSSPLYMFQDGAVTLGYLGGACRTHVSGGKVVAVFAVGVNAGLVGGAFGFLILLYG